MLSLVLYLQGRDDEPFRGGAQHLAAVLVNPLQKGDVAPDDIAVFPDVIDGGCIGAAPTAYILNLGQYGVLPNEHTKFHITVLHQELPQQLPIKGDNDRALQWNAQGGRRRRPHCGTAS